MTNYPWLGNLPAMVIRSKAVPRLTEQEYAACHALNFGPYGGMQPILKTFRTRSVRHSRAIMAWEGDELIGWAIIFKVGSDWGIMMFVKSKYRRLGIGRTLLSRARMGRRNPLRSYETNSQIYWRAEERGQVQLCNWWQVDRPRVYA